MAVGRRTWAVVGAGGERGPVGGDDVVDADSEAQAAGPQPREVGVAVQQRVADAFQELRRLPRERIANARQQGGIAAGDVRDRLRVRHRTEGRLELLLQHRLGQHRGHAGGQAAIAVFA